MVSHDRDFLDACVDHILALNRQTIEVQSGNFSSWWENRNRKDAFVRMENERHRKEIAKLKEATGRSRQWADKNESTKIGYDPVKEPGRANRAYIGEKTRKMQSRVKQMEKRIEREIEEKEGLLQDVENPVDLKIMPLAHFKETLLYVNHYGLRYGSAAFPRPELYPPAGGKGIPGRGKRMREIQPVSGDSTKKRNGRDPGKPEGGRNAADGIGADHFLY